MIRAVASLAAVVFVLSNVNDANAQTVLPEANSCTSLQKTEGRKSKDTWSPKWRVVNNCPERIFVKIAHNYGLDKNNIKCSNSSGVSISPGSSYVFNTGPLPRGVSSWAETCSQYSSDELQRLSGFRTCYQAEKPRCPGDAARAPTQSDGETTTKATTQPPGNTGKAAASAPMQQAGRPASKANTPANAGAETAAKTTTQPPGPKCADVNRGDACWREISNKPGCWVLDPYKHPGEEEKVTWSGSCSGGFPSGKGIASWEGGDYGSASDTGTYVNGKQHGQWVFHSIRGIFMKGPLVEGKKHGQWVNRWPDGHCEIQEFSEDKYVEGSARPC